MQSAKKSRAENPTDLEVCILAGGLSSRMGRDKSKLHLGRKTFVSKISSTAKELGREVRILRKDMVPRCGPLGGIYTALKTAKAGAVLFLACDSPFVSFELLDRLVSQFRDTHQPIFTRGEAISFPFILPIEALATVENQIRQSRFSIQALALVVTAHYFFPTPDEAKTLFNINTPEDLLQATQMFGKG